MQVVVIDGKGHLFGRLASIVAKQLLSGQKVVVVRCEGIEITGSLIRNKLKYLRYLDKKMRTNPSRGPDHFPFQGVKDSGIGSQGITNSIALMTKVKTTGAPAHRPPGPCASMKGMEPYSAMGLSSSYSKTSRLYRR